MRILFYIGCVTRAMVVCPASLKRNWYRELNIWGPELSVQIIEGASGTRERQWSRPVDIFIASYECLRNDIDRLGNHNFSLIVCDEAQRIKNSRAKLTRAVKELKRERSWCLTGTPLENDVNELASVIDFIDRASAESLYSAYLWEDVKPILDGWMGRFFMRRRKADVLKELPSKRYRDLDIQLATPQRKAYSRALDEGKMYLSNLGESITIQHVLALLTRLKQICNFDPETGASTKLDILRDFINEIKESGEKTLVFSQFRETVVELASRLSDIGPLVYHGGLSQRERDHVLSEFRIDPNRRLLLMTLRAGGVGLNLQEASYVVHFDRWWNPAVELQAEDRAHRIGQKRGLLVTRFIAANTVEEKIRDILDRKRVLFDIVVNQSVQAEATGLTPEELFGLLDLSPSLKHLNSSM